jgi:hypothetical protein
MSFRSNSLNKVRQDLMQYGPPSKGAIQKAQEDENQINIDDSENSYADQERYNQDLDDRIIDSENSYADQLAEQDETPNLNKFLMKQKFQQDLNY